MTRGWRGEPRRHQLAAMGIKTRVGGRKLLRAEGVIKDIVEFPDGVAINYDIPRHVFSLFWVCVLNNDYTPFDFNLAFSKAEGKIYQKLYDHALMGPEATLEYLRELHPGQRLRYVDFAQNRLVRSWCTFLESEDALARVVGEEGARWLLDHPDKPIKAEMALALAADVHEVAKQSFLEDTPYRVMVETYNMLQDRPTELKEKIFLMDRIIDTYHVGGSLWDIDVERIRNQVMKLYERYGGQ